MDVYFDVLFLNSYLYCCQKCLLLSEAPANTRSMTETEWHGCKWIYISSFYLISQPSLWFKWCWIPEVIRVCTRDPTMHYNCRLQIYIIKVKNFSASLADIITSCCFFLLSFHMFCFLLLFLIFYYCLPTVLIQSIFSRKWIIWMHKDKKNTNQKYKKTTQRARTLRCWGRAITCEYIHYLTYALIVYYLLTASLHHFTKRGG